MRRLIALLVMATSCAAGFSAPAPEDGPRLLEDITILRQLAPLGLSLAQVDGLLGICRELGLMEPEAAFNEKTLDELSQIKARLLRGEGMTREDLVVLSGVIKLSGGAKLRARSLPQIDAALRQVLTADQMQILQQPQIPDKAADRTQEQIARANLKVLAGVANVAEEDWLQVRGLAAEGLVQGLGDPGDRLAARRVLAAFLDRLRALGAQGITEQADELAGDLQALMPEGMGLLTADSLALDRAQTRAGLRALAVFASPALPRVLLELKAALEK